jgi:hypothetical protein
LPQGFCRVLFVDERQVCRQAGIWLRRCLPTRYIRARQRRSRWVRSADRQAKTSDHNGYGESQRPPTCISHSVRIRNEETPRERDRDYRVPATNRKKDGQSDRTVIACMDDGVMPMNVLNVMITISKHRKQWSNPR